MKIQIVDEQDNIVGVKERSEVDYDKDIYRSSALWLTNSKNQALLAKRAATKDKDPGKWGPAVAGTIDEGENYDNNIYKEAEEEIGLIGVALTKGPKMRVKGPKNYFCQWYHVNLDREADSFTRQKSEVDELKWVDIERLKKDLRTNPDNYVPALPKIIKELDL